MLLTVFLIGLLGSSLAGFSDNVPAQPTVTEYDHSAKIVIDPNNVPAGADRVHIAAKELNDLTGNRFEEGYDFPFNAAVPFYYYPQLTDGKFHVFVIKYGRSNDDGVEWSKNSAETHYLHSDSSRFSLSLMSRAWPMAKDRCIDEGKRLAVITGQKSNEMVKKLLIANNRAEAWIGLYDIHYNDDNAKTTWAWVDNSPFKYSKFEYGAQVEKSELRSAVAAINKGGEWETLSPNQKLPFVCEVGPTVKVKQAEARVGLTEADMQM